MFSLVVQSCHQWKDSLAKGWFTEQSTLISTSDPHSYYIRGESFSFSTLANHYHPKSGLFGYTYVIVFLF